MKTDLLKRIYEEKLREDEAYELCDKVIEWVVASVPEGEEYDLADALGMNPVEYTAFAHGLPIKVLSDWRYSTWPSSCIECGQFLIPEKYSWFPEERNGVWGLAHLDCLPQAEEGKDEQEDEYLYIA